MCRPTPAEERPPTDRDWSTAELPGDAAAILPDPGRALGRGAEPSCATLGADLGIELVAYKRRIGRYLLWRAGPAAGADARYMAIAADDPGERWTFRLFPDGSGEGDAPGGSHTRFRTWKEDLRDASAA